MSIQRWYSQFLNSKISWHKRQFALFRRVEVCYSAQTSWIYRGDFHIFLNSRFWWRRRRCGDLRYFDVSRFVTLLKHHEYIEMIVCSNINEYTEMILSYFWTQGYGGVGDDSCYFDVSRFVTSLKYHEYTVIFMYFWTQGFDGVGDDLSYFDVSQNFLKRNVMVPPSNLQ